MKNTSELANFVCDMVKCGFPSFFNEYLKSARTEFVQFYSSPKALRHNGVLLGQYPFCHLGLHPSGAAVKVLYFHETEALN